MRIEQRKRSQGEYEAGRSYELKKNMVSSMTWKCANRTDKNLYLNVKNYITKSA